MLASKIVDIDKARIERGLVLLLPDLDKNPQKKAKLIKKVHRGFIYKRERNSISRHQAIQDAIYRIAAEEHLVSLGDYDHAKIHNITHIAYPPKKWIHDVILSKLLAILAVIIAIIAMAIALFKSH